MASGLKAYQGACDRTKALAKDVQSFIAETRTLLEESRRLLDRSGQIPAAPAPAEPQLPIIVQNGSTDDAVDGLLAAHNWAKAEGDQFARLTIEMLLRHFGERLALELGPKAAGLVTN